MSNQFLVPEQVHAANARQDAFAARATERHSLLALWHLLSLDAPTVATLWLWFVARCSGVLLRWTSMAAMFVAVWMLYVADRLLDAHPLDTSPYASELEERHRFHHRHRAAFLAVFLAATAALAWLLPHIDADALRIYAVLACLLLGYFFLIHVVPASNAGIRLPKELAVGVFFPAAIFIPTVARAPSMRLMLLPEALLLAAVCTLNCLYLYAWEHPSDRRTAHWTTRFAVRHLRLLTTITIFCAAALVICNMRITTAPHPLFLVSLACCLSAVLLLSLDACRNRLLPIHLRAAADLALLTPVLLLPLLRMLA